MTQEVRVCPTASMALACLPVFENAELRTREYLTDADGARSTRDLLNALDEITRRGAGFKSLADTWADTTTPYGLPLLRDMPGGPCRFEWLRGSSFLTQSRWR
jgi:hypothetical protein